MAYLSACLMNAGTLEGRSLWMAGYYSEILEAVEDPDAIYEGRLGELLAIKKYKAANI